MRKIVNLTDAKIENKKQNTFKEENLDESDKKEGGMAKRKNKTVWGVIGVILTLFGVTATIPILLNREYLVGLPVTATSVIIGVILIAWAFSD